MTSTLRWACLFILGITAFYNLAFAIDPNYPPITANANGQPVAWPAEASGGAANCKGPGTCGGWTPYTRFQQTINDPAIQDPSNGGTSPQNYVNISSSCTDKAQPSIYYHLSPDPGGNEANDVLMFRWRVQTQPNTYAIGPSAGNYGATDPWKSALWSVLFDLNGDGFIDVAAQLDGSSGAPSTPVDRLVGIWSTLPTQSLDYVGDPTHVIFLSDNPTGFTGTSAAGSGLLNFQNSLTPVTTWPSGSSATYWDYGTTRATVVTTSPCAEYFIDYQIPVSLLNASGKTDVNGKPGPQITRSTPISMLFCTSNSLNNPFQKDCALNSAFIAAPGAAAPFGDYISFNQTSSYAQPIVASVSATPPNSCPGSYTLNAVVQDTLGVVNGVTVPSVQSVDFYYYYDANGNGLADDGNSWTLAGNGTLASGSMTNWSTSWSGASLPKGKYLIGVQALDNNTIVDLGMTPTGINNRTFSYVNGDSSNRIYINGSTAGLNGGPSFVSPLPSPPNSTSSSENWWGNPSVTGTQVALVGLALNTCGVAPTITKTASPANIAANGQTTYTVTIGNNSGSSISLSQISDALPSGFSYLSTTSVTNANVPVTPTSVPTGSPAVWGFSPSLTIANGSSVVLSFVAQAGGTAGTYNNIASATTSFGTLTSSPAAVQVDTARLSLSKTPSVYSISPDGTTHLTYTLNYSNDSSVTVTSASISDTLPTGETFVSCSGGSACSNSSGTVSWTLGNLVGGTSGSATVTVTVNTSFTGLSLLNTATLSASPPTGAQVSTSGSATVAVTQPAPAFTLTKSASATQIAPGASVTWTIAYKNYGVGTASGVTITDPLPAGFTYSSCAPSTGGVTCGVSNGTVTWSLGSVAAGASGSVTVVATAAAAPFTYPNPAGNTATIAWTGNSTGISASNTLGVTGQSCSAVYYFHGPTTNRTATLTPPSSTDAMISEQPGTTTLVFAGVAPAGGLDVSSGKTLTISFYMAASTGNATFDAVLYDATSGQTIADSGAVGVSNSGGSPVLQTFTATPSSGVTIAAGDVLQWKFTLGGSGQLPTFYYNSQTDNSRSSVCQSSSPANLTLTKTTDSPVVSTLPTTIHYTLTFANTGGTTASGVSVVDTLPANVIFTSATLNGTSITPTVNGSQLTFTNVNSSSDTTAGNVSAGTSGTIVVTATVGSSASGTLVNTATVSGTNLSSASASASTMVGSASTGSPALSISKSANKTSVTAGGAVTYTLTVVNTGAGAASGVVVSDALPVQAYYSYGGNCTTASGTCSVNTNTLSWNIGSLASGASATLTFTMNVAGSGVPAGVTVLPNTATVADSSYCTGSSPPASCTSNTVNESISGNPYLVVTKTASPSGNVAPGGVISYTLSVTNTGSATALGVVVADPIPTDLNYQALGTASGGTPSFDAVNNQVLLNATSLASGATASLVFTAKVAALPSGSTNLQNTATATANNASAQQANAYNTAVSAPTMSLQKSGPASLPMPAAVLSKAATASNQIYLNSAAALAVGNWVQVGGGTPVSVLQIKAIAGNSVTLSAPVTAASGAQLLLGGTWSMLYQNTGNADASGVTLSDPLPAGWLYVGASPAPTSAPTLGAGGTVSWSLGTVSTGSSGTVQVTAIPVGSGAATNTASLAGGNFSTVTGSASVNLGGITVTKTTSTPLSAAGSTASYTITLSNSLSAAVSGAIATDQLPTGFSYQASSATVGTTPTEPSFATQDTVHNQPIWTSLTVPANGSLAITFTVNIGSDVGAGTYKNAVVLSGLPAGVGQVPFDPFQTTAADVTVLAAGTGVVQGTIYQDNNGNGSYEAGVDLPLTGILIDISYVQNGITTTYTVATDGNGFYSQVVPAGAAVVTVHPIGADGGPPAGMGLATGNAQSNNVTVTAAAVATQNVGFNWGSVPDVYTTVNLPTTVNPGAVVNGVVTFGNQGGSNASGISYTLQLPSGLSGVYCAGAGCSYDPSTGLVTLTSLPGSLSPGQTVQVGISFQAPSINSSSLTVTATIATTTTGETPTSNNTATGTTTTTAANAPTPLADGTTWVTAPAAGYCGGTVNVSVGYSNIGGANATSVTFGLSNLPSGALVSYLGISCSVGGGVVSGCGLPSTLPIGQSLSLQVSYTNPSNACLGTVNIGSQINWTNPDSSTGSNTATSATSFGAPPATPLADMAATAQIPSKATIGKKQLVPVTFSNIGPASAAGVSYTINLGAGSGPAPGSVQVTYNGVVCGYSNGVVSGCGLPTTLQPGQSVPLVLSFVPASSSTQQSLTVQASTGTTTPEITLSNNSVSGVITVPNQVPSGSISGRVWYDTNGNRIFDAGESGRANWNVDLMQDGVVIASTLTDATGQYSFTQLDNGIYSVRFMPRIGSGLYPVNGDTGSAPAGGGIPGLSVLSNIVVTNSVLVNAFHSPRAFFTSSSNPAAVTGQSLPLDPSGTVYDSTTRTPISGANVTLGYTCGSVQPAWVGGGSTSVTTGADGNYAFYLIQGVAPNVSGCYYTLTVSAAGYVSPSKVLPTSGYWSSSGGSVSGVTGAPQTGQVTTYYLSGPYPTSDLTNNNIPLDPGAQVAAIPTLSGRGLLWLEAMVLLMLLDLGWRQRHRQA